MEGIDWETEAVRVANYIAQHIVDLHRGALIWHHGIIVAFGTDGYVTEEKSQDVVQLLMQIVEIPAWKTERLAFGTNNEVEAGRTWALLLDPAQSEDVVGLVESLDVAIWAAWDLAHGRTPANNTDHDRRLTQESRLRKLRPPRRR